MKLLFIGPNLGPGGAERQASILLPALRRRGHDARLIALDGGGPFAESLAVAGVPIEVLNIRGQFDLPRLARSRILRGFSPEVIVSRGVSGLYIGQLVARARRARHVFNEHRQVGLAVSRRRETMIRLLAHRLDLVIAVTPGQTAAWIERGYPPDRILIVPNGVEPPDVTEDRQSVRQTLAVAADAVVAVSVCSLRPEKRVVDFTEAVLRARERQPELVGLVVGDGPERMLIDRAQMASPGGIIALGQRADVARILSAADIFVSASQSEASPMAILEAMAAGLPVIATPVGGVPQMVEDGRSGVLVTPRSPGELASALEQMAADPAGRAGMGQRGLELHRERWSAEQMVNGYIKALSAVLSGAQTNHGAHSLPRS
jgi:glycosyltransferase involved in cell wall biosynthesis